MAKFVFCTLPYASLEINGIAFEECTGGVVSVDPVDDEEAESLGSIPGYELLDEKPGEKAAGGRGRKKAASGSADASAAADAAAAAASEAEAAAAAAAGGEGEGAAA